MKKLLSVLALLTIASFNVSAQCSLTNLNAWSSVSIPDTGALDVTAASAMNLTTCGVEISIAGPNKNYVQDTNPNGEQRYRARFYVNPNAISLPTTGFNRRVKFHIAQCVAAVAPCRYNAIVQFKLAKQDTEGYVLDGFVVGGPASDGAKRFRVDIPDTGETRIEYDVDLTTGTFKLWMNATTEADPVAVSIRPGEEGNIDYSGLNMADWAGGVSRARVGFMNTPAGVPNGEPIYFDEFESRRQTFIGQ